MKLGVIGGSGRLGATTAFCVGVNDLVDEIKLFDIKENMTAANVMDMGQAFLPLNRTKVSHARRYEDFSDCDIIYCAAAKPYSKEIKDRAQELKMNIELIAPICEELKKNCKDSAILIISANPVDVFVYVYWKLLGWDKNRILGLSLNDTIRLKWATANVTGLEYSNINGVTIGEHGGAAVRLYDQMTYGCKALNLSEDERLQIERMCSEWFENWVALETGTTTGYTSATSITSMIEAIVHDTQKIIPCSTVYCDSVGYDGCAMGLPVKLGKDGIEEVVLPELTDDQRNQLDVAAKKISEMIKSVGY